MPVRCVCRATAGLRNAARQPSLAEHRAVWQKTLSAPALQKLNRWYVPEDVKQRYQQLQLGWQEMDTRIASGDTGWYQSHIEDFVGRIDAFVLALQHYTEHKIQLVIFMSLTGGRASCCWRW